MGRNGALRHPAGLNGFSRERRYLQRRVIATSRVPSNCQLRVLPKIGGGLSEFSPRHITAICDADYIKKEIYTIVVKFGRLYDLEKRMGG